MKTNKATEKSYADYCRKHGLPVKRTSSTRNSVTVKLAYNRVINGTNCNSIEFITAANTGLYPDAYLHLNGKCVGSAKHKHFVEYFTTRTTTGENC